MKTKLRLLIILLAVVFVYEEGKAQAPGWQWAKKAIGIHPDEGNSISADASGNVVVTGGFQSQQISFGSIPLGNADIWGFHYDVFIVKYNASGNVLWAKSAGGTLDDIGYGITTDASGNVLVTGIFTDSITFGTTTLTDTGGSGIFVVKYNTLGNVMWAISAGGIYNDDGLSIGTDASGNVLITGFFQSDSITFGTTTLYNGTWSKNIFVVKYDSFGNVMWAKSAGAYNNYGIGISTDASGNVLVAGIFGDSITFGTTTLFKIGAASTNIFVAKYDASGNVQWAKSGVGFAPSDEMGIATDANGNVLVACNFIDTVIYGTTTLISAGNSDIVVIKYDALGNVLWAKSAGGTSVETVHGLSTDASGSVLVTGDFASDSMSFGTTTLTNASLFNSDMFILKYDSSGNPLWATSAGGTSYDNSYGIATDASGRVLITGRFNSPSITFGTTTLTNTGSTDIFVAKLDGITGIAELNATDNRVSIYPNPSTGQITIISSKIIDEVTITNPLGQIIYQSKTSNKKISLQIKDDGIYFVTITSDKKTATGKVIVQH